MDHSSRSECELPGKMASLELWDPSSLTGGEATTSQDDSESEGSSLTRRSLRRRPQPTPLTTNRRVILKPKRIEPSTLTEEDLKKIYCNKKVSSASQNLETIFEEPKAINNTMLLIGGRKIKRSLRFTENSVYTKEKIKKRRSKIKRLLGNKNIANRKKISMQSFLKTLQTLDEDPAEELQNN